MPRFRSIALVAASLLVSGAGVLTAQVESRPGSLPGDSTVTLRTVEVRGSATGRGRVQAANALTRADLLLRSPGTTPLKAAERLPGVNFQSSDPFGSYEWSTTLTMRGFQSGQIGQTFDGITLGNMQYGNFNGLGVGRAVDAENLEYVVVHEMVHLIEPRHSERFVALMNEHYPTWREARAELNELPLAAESWKD